MSSGSSVSVSSRSNISNKRLFSLSVSMVAVLLDLIRFTVENKRSTEQLVTGNVIKTRSKLFMLGKTSLSHESKTSIKDGYR